MVHAKSSGDAYIKLITTFIFFITLNFTLNAQTFDFESVIGENTASMTQTVSTVTATVTRSDGGIVSSAVAVSNAVYGESTSPGGTLTISFNKSINISSFQFVEFSDKNEGMNFVVTPSKGTAYTIADNAAALSDYVETVNPADWIGVTSLVMSYNGSSNWIPGIDEIAFTVNTDPTITNTAYNYVTNTLVVTGENFIGKSGETNDVDVSTLTIRGEGGATYTLASTGDVEISSPTSFTVTLSEADAINVEGLLNKDGNQSDGGTSYNLGAADDWMAGVTAGDISDATNQIFVSVYSAPTITSAAYDYGTNTLIVTGTNLVRKIGATNDVDISRLTITGENGGTHTLTSASDVEISSATQFSITLAGSDVTNVEALLNKDGETSYSGGTMYNVAAADNWLTAAPSSADISDAAGNKITVSNYALPAITSSDYDYSTNIMTVHGTNFVSNSSGADVDVSKFQIDNGDGKSTMTMYSTDVEITSDTEFSFTISGDDLPRSEYLMNKDGSKNIDGFDYAFIANDDWMTAVPSTPNILDLLNTLTVSNYAVPVITSVAYNYNTNVLTFTGTDFINNPFVTNDVDVSLLTIKGEGGSTYTLSSTGDVEVLDGSTFSITLSGTDIPNVEALLNKDGGTSYTSGTTYNMAASEDWMLPVPSGNNCADATTGITVSQYAAPNITTCTYNASNGQLVLNGTNFVISSGANDDIDASLLRIGGAGANEYTLTNTSDVDIASATSATIILSTEDRLNVNGLLNNNGTTAGDLTPYNVAAAEDWMTGSPSGVNVIDGTATINVNSVSTPTIVSATFNYTTAQFVVTATNLAAKYGSTNDIDVSKLTITGEGGSTYTLSSTPDVEVTSSTQFTIDLSGADVYNVKALLNKNDKKSADNTTYNFAAAEDWMAAADANATIADVSSNEITVSDFTNPVIASATYDISSGQLVVSGTDFVNKSGANNDIDASLFTITGGPSGATYTLTSSDVELTSGTSFTITLNAEDQLNVNGLLNKNLTVSAEGTTYNLAAAEDWMVGSPSGNTIADLTGNSINVSNVAVPTIASATYNQTTGGFVVTGTNFFKAYGTDNDVDISNLTVTGEGGNYTISDALTDVEITSSTEFSFTLTGTDKTQVDAKLDRVGQSSSGGTTYNIAAADNWLKAADVSTDISDATGNTIDVYIPPTISLATYNASTGALVITGANIQANSGGSDIDASKFTVTGEGGETYTLTNTSDVNRTSVTEFTLTLSAADKDKVNQILNKNVTESTSGTTYNIAAADDWCTNVSAGNTEDLTGNGITVSSVSVPVIIATGYNVSTGVLSFTGAGFVKKAGTNNDVDVSKFTFTGEEGETYTLTNTPDVEITSGTSISVTLSAADKAVINTIINKNGTISTGGTPYNITAAEDWMTGTDTSINVADPTGQGITVANVAVPVITSASYHWSDGILTASGYGFTKYAGADNDIDASMFTFSGEGGGIYTLVGSADVEITSYNEFSITLDATDKAAINILLNKEGAQSEDNTVYNLAAAEDWAKGAFALLNIVDATTPINAGNFNTPPTSTNDLVSVTEDTQYIFEVSDFVFEDVDNDNFNGIKITTIETKGDLKYNGVEVTLNLDCQDVTLLTFDPVPEESGSPYTTFEFQVKDDRGGYSDLSYTMTIHVGPVNDLPVIADSAGFTVDEGGNYVLTNSNLSATDTEDEDHTLSFSITQQPKWGTIITEGSFTQNEVANGKVSYKHDGNDEYADTIKVVAVDSGEGQSNEVTLVITINNINDPPAVSTISAITILEDESYTLNVSDWFDNINDPDNPDSILTINVSAGSGLNLSQSSVLVYVITPDEEFSGTSKLTVTISDSLESTQTEVQVNVVAVNDLPVLGSLPGSISLEHGGTDSFSIFGTDVETPDSLLSFSVLSSENGVNTSYEASTGTVTVSASEGFSGNATLTVTVTDGDNGTDFGTIEVTVAEDPTGLERLDGIPDEYSLMQNYPNPFNPSTTIRFGLPEQSDISLRVYDILGREIKLLVEATKSAGYYEYSWNADHYSSGIYFYVLTASSENNQFRQIKKMLLVK